MGATFPPPGGNLRAVNASDETTSATPSEKSQPGRLKRAATAASAKSKAAGRAVVSKPRDAGKAVAGGFRWAGGGVASQVTAAGRTVTGRTKSARDAVAAKTSPPWNAAKQRFQSSPALGIAAIMGVLLALAWIGWAIYVTSEHGTTAGLGVVISWPAVLMAVALVMAPFVGVYLLIRRLNGGGGINSGSEDSAPIAGGAPGDDESDRDTAGTYPG